jgi:hypothetical protein
MGAAHLMPLYMFVNAGIQGAANFVKNVRMYPKAMTGVIAFNAMLGFVQPFLIRLLAGDDDDEYFKLPEYTRRNNMIIPVGGGDFLKVPLSHELRVFFAIGETASSVFAGKKDVADGVIDAMSAISDIVPLDPMSAAAAGIGNVVTPDIAKPAVQAWMNRSWTGAPVYNQYANGDFPGYRNIGTNKKGEPYAPEWIISFAKMLDGATGGDGTRPGVISLNPDVLNHYAKGYLGGLYTLAAQSADVAYKGLDDDRDVRAKDIPFANRFYVANDDLNVLATDVAERFYSAREEVKGAAKYLKDYDKRAKKGEIDLLDYASKRADLSGKARFLEGLNAIEKREEMLKQTAGEQQRELEKVVAEAKRVWLEMYGKEVYGKGSE